VITRSARSGSAGGRDDDAGEGMRDRPQRLDSHPSSLKITLGVPVTAAAWAAPGLKWLAMTSASNCRACQASLSSRTSLPLARSNVVVPSSRWGRGSMP